MFNRRVAKCEARVEACGSVDELNAALTNSADRSSIVLDVARGRFIYSLTFPMAV